VVPGTFTCIDEQEELYKSVIIHNTPDNYGLITGLPCQEIEFSVRETGIFDVNKRESECPGKTGGEDLGCFRIHNIHDIVPYTGMDE
jgi:hypothetical protein